MKNASSDSVAAVILAAGLGTRMKSGKAKVLHELFDRPMISYVVETATAVVGENVVVVVGHQAEKVKAVASGGGKIAFALQAEQLGTGHAVLCALEHLPGKSQHVLILCGDVPLLTVKTLHMLIDEHLQANRDVTVLAIELDDPTGYGRILLGGARNLMGIVEETDASDAQKQIRLVNTGIYCVQKDFLIHGLGQINTQNAQGELYLTDIIGVGYHGRHAMGVTVAPDADETIGINSVHDLAAAQRMLQKRLK